MPTRIPLILDHGQLVLYAVITYNQRAVLVPFLLDTGSKETYLNERATQRLAPEGEPAGHVLFAGSRLRKTALNNVQLQLWAGKDRQDRDTYLRAVMHCFGLRPTSRRHRRTPLPCILGMDFLIEHQFSLHVIPDEGIAYLEADE